MHKTAYLTIDDAPTEDLRERIDFLDSKGIKAIWFCQGDKLEEFPDEAVYAIKKGHVIGNHSYDHADFSKISLDEAREQIEKTDRIIDSAYARANASRPIKIFRFPFCNIGSKKKYQKCDWNNDHVKGLQKILGETGYRQPRFEGIDYQWYRKAGFDKCLNVDYTYDSFDYCLAAGVELFGYRDLPTVLARIDEDVPEGGRGLNNPDSNEIIIMHAWIPLDAFKAIISKIMGKGISFKLPA